MDKSVTDFSLAYTLKKFSRPHIIKVVGTSKIITDYTVKLDIQNLLPGDEVYFDPEPFNRYDKNAIAVMIPSGFREERMFTKIGYIPNREKLDVPEYEAGLYGRYADMFTALMKQGYTLKGMISNLSGMYDKFEYIGIEIIVTLIPPKQTSEQASIKKD